MGQIQLKNGAVFSNSILSYETSGNQLLLTIPGNDIVQFATLFGNPKNTEEISYESGFFRDYYFGYTRLISLTAAGDGSMIIRLGAEGETSTKKEYAVPEEYVPEYLRLPKE